MEISIKKDELFEDFDRERLSLVHTCEISTGISTSICTRMFTLATYACAVMPETFSSLLLQNWVALGKLC